MTTDLVNPDESVGEDKFQWELEFQRQIIAMLIVDRGFLLQSLDLIKPKYFTNKVHSKICHILFDHFHKYKVPPNRTIITQEIMDSFKEDKSQAYYLAELSSLFDYFEPGLDSREYLLDKIVYFARHMRLKQFWADSVKKLEKNSESEEVWEFIYQDMQEVVRIDRNFDVGTQYFDNYRERYKEMETEEEKLEVFPTGYNSVDSCIKDGGLIRGEIGSVVADSGVGKSRTLKCIALFNALKGRKILYISTELSEKRIASRLDAMISDQPVNMLLNPDVKSKLFDTLDYWSEEGCKILIKMFPAGSLTVEMIRAYINQLKYHGLTFDMLFVDYIGDMKDYSGLKVYESREKIVKELRGLASEEKLVCWTAMQTNRSAKEVQETDVIDRDTLGDSYGQIRPLDLCFSLNMNSKEKNVEDPASGRFFKLGRLFIIKAREGRDGVTFKLKFDSKTLKIKQVSNEYYNIEMNRTIEKIADKVSVDELNSVVTPIDYTPTEGDNDD